MAKLTIKIVSSGVTFDIEGVNLWQHTPRQLIDEMISCGYLPEETSCPYRIINKSGIKINADSLNLTFEQLGFADGDEIRIIVIQSGGGGNDKFSVSESSWIIDVLFGAGHFLGGNEFMMEDNDSINSSGIFPEVSINESLDDDMSFCDSGNDNLDLQSFIEEHGEDGRYTEISIDELNDLYKIPSEQIKVSNKMISYETNPLSEIDPLKGQCEHLKQLEQLKNEEKELIINAEREKQDFTRKEKVIEEQIRDVNHRIKECDSHNSKKIDIIEFKKEQICKTLNHIQEGNLDWTSIEEELYVLSVLLSDGLVLACVSEEAMVNRMFIPFFWDKKKKQKEIINKLNDYLATLQEYEIHAKKEFENDRTSLEEIKRNHNIQLRKLKEVFDAEQNEVGTTLYYLKEKISSIEGIVSEENVFSSIFAPAEIRCRSRLLVQVYLHLYEETENVKALAVKSDKNAERRDYIPLQCKLKKGDKVDVLLNIYGETLLMSDKKSVVWQGSFTKCSFDYFVPKDIDVDELSCMALLTVNDIPIGEMRFITRIVELPRKLNPEIIAHRYNKVFISYAHKDEAKVKSFHEGLKLAGIEHFFDRAYLKTGDVYPQVIQDYINSADLFVLFWSENAAQSDYVQKERTQALERAFPQIKPQQEAKLSIYPMSIEPRAELPSDMKEYYHFGEI